MYDDLTFLKDKRPNSEGKIPIYEVNNTQETKDFVISEDETYDIEGQINDKMEKMSDNPTDPGDKVSLDHLNETNKKLFKSIIEKYPGAWAQNANSLGEFKAFHYDIELKDPSISFKDPARRYDPDTLRNLERNIKQLLDMGVLDYSTEEPQYISNFLPVVKMKGGKSKAAINDLKRQNKTKFQMMKNN